MTFVQAQVGGLAYNPNTQENLFILNFPMEAGKTYQLVQTQDPFNGWNAIGAPIKPTAAQTYSVSVGLKSNLQTWLTVTA